MQTDLFKPMNIGAKKRLVLEAIANNPAAADDDAVLVAECWAIELQKRGSYVKAKQLLEIVQHCSRADSLTRRRRELFNEGKIKYSTAASKRRMSAYKQEIDNAAVAAWGETVNG